MPAAEDSIATTSAEETIDLSTVENWVLRQEMLGICRKAVAQDFTVDVCTSVLLLTTR